MNTNEHRRNLRPRTQQLTSGDHSLEIPSKIIRLLVVLEPNRRKSLIDEEMSYTDWVRRDIPECDARALLQDLEVKGFIHLEKKENPVRKPGLMWVRMHESLFMVYHWQKTRDDLEISYMSLELLLRILNGGGIAIEALAAKFSAFYGGVDFAVSLLSYYDDFPSPAEVDVFTFKMKYMASIMPVWPPIAELMHSRHKFNVIRDLDHIAENVTKTARPRTTLLSQNRNVDSHSFLKREASDCSHHICNPQKACALPQSKIEEMALEMPFRWLKQEYVPALRDIGEWRVLIVGGRILYVVNSMLTGDDCDVCGAELRMGGFTLKEMETMMNRDPNVIGDDIMDRRGGSVTQRALADDELYAFCLTTLKALVQREAIWASSLTLICRMDISIIRNSNGNLNYFVNEVERGSAICLFGHIETDYLVERVADELGPLFVEWIRRRQAEIEEEQRKEF